jgi:hypothetical protein
MRKSHSYPTLVAAAASCLVLALAATPVTAQSKQASKLTRLEHAHAKCTAQFSGRWYVDPSSPRGSHILQRCIQQRMGRE